jgi:hypothetical protein
MAWGGTGQLEVVGLGHGGGVEIAKAHRVEALAHRPGVGQGRANVGGEEIERPQGEHPAVFNSCRLRQSPGFLR